ncbi:HAE1 family hydrophobic/amphiphilic exporter-1 [Microbacteriaceae bacterium MWH-Ta3]|nr:HAE1 family hydrophobic/amphiphilic exporter-1 [Microbacteriaceae bacterium MWH-Ta3]
MNLLSKFSLRNRALIALVTIVVAIFGGISMSLLKLELIPSVTFPQLVVVTNYPGASPLVVENEVSTPIETAIQSVPGLETTTATSQTGVSQVSASFAYGTNLESAEQKVQLAINRIITSLPADVEPQIIAGSFDDIPVMQIAVTSDQEQDALAAALESIAVKELNDVSGVREVNIIGATGQHIEIIPSASKLDDAGLTPQNITDALRSNGIRLGAGTVTDDGAERSVVAGVPLDSLDAIADIPLSDISSANPLTGTVEVTTIGDVADVVIVDDTVTSVSRVNGEPALTMAITKTADANTVDVARDIRAALPEIGTLLGAGTTLTIVFDQAPFIESSIESLATEGMLGLAFAILIILVFLMSVRSTLVTAISIPASVLLTFIGMWASDYTLNILTIGAVTISIGRVVDDSIVVVENIKRHLALGEERMQAILTGVREVATAVTASTVTTVAVFLPLAFVGGITGELFQPFAVTVTIALLASLFVSLTIVPVLSYWFLPASDKSIDKETGEEKLGRLQRGYRPVVGWTIKHPLATIMIAILTLGGTVALIPSMKTNFVGDSGQNTIAIRHATPAGLSLAERVEVAATVEDELMAFDGVEIVQSSIGGGNSFAALFGSSSDITYSVTLDETVDVDALQAEITAELDSLSDVGTLTVASGGSGFGSSTIDVTVKSPTEETLNRITTDIEAAIADTGVAEEISSSIAETQDYVSVSVDRVAAAEFGMSETLVSSTIAGALAPNSVAKVIINDQTLQVFVMTANAPETLAELKAYELTTPFGKTVEVRDIADVTIDTTAARRTTERGVLSSTLEVTPATDDLTTATADIRAALDSVELPSGTTATIGGVAEDQAESFQQLGLALLAAVLIVYVVMVATFRSLRQPLLLLVSIPFAATGAIGLQIVSGIPLGLSSLIGMLMLVGIVVTNAIVLIDLVNQYRDRGQTVPTALLEGTTRRVRPVLMTALATIFALTPLALGVTGSGGFISQPLAIVVIGGLLSSTILTLLVLPALYSLVEGRKERRALRREAKAAAQAASVTAPEVTS